MKKHSILTLATASLLSVSLASCTTDTAIGDAKLLGEITDAAQLAEYGSVPNILKTITAGTEALSLAAAIDSGDGEEDGPTPVLPSTSAGSEAPSEGSGETPKPEVPVDPEIPVDPEVPVDPEEPETPEEGEVSEGDKFVEKYLTLANALLEDPVKIGVLTSDREGYASRIDYSIKSLSESDRTYSIYYNEIGDNSAVKSAEEIAASLAEGLHVRQNSLIQMEGIVVDGEAVYTFTGVEERVVRDEKTTSTVTAYLRIDEQNFARIVQTDKDSRSQYSYELYEKGVLATKTSIETKTKSSRTAVSFEIENADGTSRSFEATKREKNNRTYLVIEDLSFSDAGISWSEIWVRITVAEDGAEKLDYFIHSFSTNDSGEDDFVDNDGGMSDNIHGDDDFHHHAGSDHWSDFDDHFDYFWGYDWSYGWGGDHHTRH